jgi:molybdopterin-binding protein
MGKKRKKLKGTVDKVIEPVVQSEPQKAQISVREGDELYREIRIENVLSDEHGEKAQLKPGAEVDVIVKADSSATTKKSTP